MSTLHWKNVTLPGTGDDLLGALPTAVDTAGIITTASSVAAARVTLTKAATQGATITPTHPAYFDINAVLYRADGTKSSDGVWVLRPVNEPEFDLKQFAGPGSITVAQDEAHTLASSNLAARPYDRALIASATLFGVGTAGRTNLIISVSGSIRGRSRFDVGDEQSNSLTIQARIPAGTDPLIEIGVHGGPGGGTVGVTGSPDFNTLAAVAFPITMA